MRYRASIRSISSVVTAVVVWGVLWVGANAGLAAAFPDRFDTEGVTESTVLLCAFIVVSALLSVLAGWICAALADRARMAHVAVLAAVQLGIGVAVQAGVWPLMPVWFHLTFLGLVVPMHLLGGRIRASRDEGSKFAMA